MNRIFNIRNTVRNSVLALFALAAFSACDEVDEADRFVQLPTIESKRNVLIEEFTGQQCTNCPDAHRGLAALTEQYGEQLITVSIHAGGLSLPEDNSFGYVGLKNNEGQEYANRWGDLDTEVGYPCAVFDRSSEVSRFVDGKWPELIRKELKKPTSLSINLEAHYNNDSTKIEITALMLPETDANAKLQLWITESNITAVQIDNGKLIMDYVHNHVFRGSANGTWGEDIALESNVYSTATATVDVKDIWNVRNLAVVAFVYND
ncbi:MAG: Omp28 family outer membrane lipoprotein, partial [Prevotella sp.]|nr:Omp28 family outer membrane lipoprotein [Prevotella sp.]